VPAYPDISAGKTTAPSAIDRPLAEKGQPLLADLPEAGSEILLIPVAGITRAQLQDTYTQSRSGGRIHNAIDIMAPAGAPVLAASDGEIAKFFDSKQGGITIYQWNSDRTRVFYYAHLQRRDPRIHEGDRVKRGTVIGYVGDTGNAGTGNYHLHFSIIIPDSKGGYWNGTNINPYPVLKGGIEAPSNRE
jgi:murein DD-endopeptidase MepM/ murein hydrolase activator NlpD